MRGVRISIPNGLFQNGQIGNAGDPGLCSRCQGCLDELVIVTIPADRRAQFHRRHPQTGNSHPVEPRLDIHVETLFQLHIMQNALTFGKDVLGNDGANQAVQPGL